MKLLGPSFLRIKMSEKDHEEAAELCNFGSSGMSSIPNLIENGRGFPLRARLGVAVVESVVGKTAAVLMEILMALAERLEKVQETGNVNVCRCGQMIRPFIEE